MLTEEILWFGVKQLQTWNVALLLKQIWAVEQEKERPWVRWVLEYYLKGSSMWSFTRKQGCSYG